MRLGPETLRPPSRQDLQRAYDKTVPDVIGPGLKVLFCGINPGLYSAAVGHHFARPGNRFWPALYAAGFTDRFLSPFEDAQLLALGYGITNIVDRASAGADDLLPEELRQGARRLEIKVRRFGLRCVAFLGITVYRTAFERPQATVGPQHERMGHSVIWVLPNPSGLNAHYQLGDFVDMFRRLRSAAEGAPMPTQSRGHRTLLARRGSSSCR